LNFISLLVEAAGPAPKVTFPRQTELFHQSDVSNEGKIRLKCPPDAMKASLKIILKAA
jgi:hypothetical protein